uniref:Putative secreted protein n=1 Tax=Anopheles marajoara TaxID=58244 RepID=A0A2M4CA13_9DIPT
MVTFCSVLLLLCAVACCDHHRIIGGSQRVQCNVCAPQALVVVVVVVAVGRALNCLLQVFGYFRCFCPTDNNPTPLPVVVVGRVHVSSA